MNDVLFQNPAVRSKSVPGNCTLVLFHAPWCPFSAKAAPHYNALPRAYPPLRVVAIDVQKWKSVNTYFGILGVPNVALFHNGRLIAKFNDSQFTLNKFSEFVEYFTGYYIIILFYVKSKFISIFLSIIICFSLQT